MTTPTHCGAPMIPRWSATWPREQIGWVCLCGREEDLEGRQVGAAAPRHQATEGRLGRRRGRPEDPVVKDVVEALFAVGAPEVLRVGQRRADLGGSDAGVPDVLAVVVDALWLGVECKAPGKLRPSDLSDKQRKLQTDGRIVVVDNGADAAAAWLRAREAFGRSERDGGN